MSSFWLLLMLRAIHHFRSNFFKRRYGSKITAPFFFQITPRKFSRQQPTFGSLHSNIIAKLALEMTYVRLRSFKVLRPFCLLKTMNERCYWGVPLMTSRRPQTPNSFLPFIHQISRRKMISLRIEIVYKKSSTAFETVPQITWKNWGQKVDL